MIVLMTTCPICNKTLVFEDETESLRCFSDEHDYLLYLYVDNSLVEEFMFKCFSIHNFYEDDVTKNCTELSYNKLGFFKRIKIKHPFVYSEDCINMVKTLL